MVCKCCGYDEGINEATGQCPSCGTKVTKAQAEPAAKKTKGKGKK